MGWVAAGGNVLRQVFEADVREAIVGSPAVRSNRRTWAYGRLDERNEALGRYVSDTRHADTTGAPPADFSGHRDNRFLLCFSTDNASLTAANVGFVNLDIALQKVSARANHGAAKLMKPRPSRLVAAKAKDPLHPQGTDPMLLIRHVPHRLEPEPQRLPRSLENRPRRRRCLAIASTASKLAPGRRPCHRRPAGRTAETFRPTNTPKIVRTGGLGRKPLIELLKRPWIVDAPNGMGCLLGHPHILSLRERSGYPLTGRDRGGKGPDDKGDDREATRELPGRRCPARMAGRNVSLQRRWGGGGRRVTGPVSAPAAFVPPAGKPP